MVGKLCELRVLCASEVFSNTVLKILIKKSERKSEHALSIFIDTFVYQGQLLVIRIVKFQRVAKVLL
jgi:hypothetical protein